MKYRKFGNSSIKVSEVGFGAWAIGGNWGEQNDSDSAAALERAVDRGVNFIDTAAGYGNGRSEKIIGQFLKGRSEQIHVCTKTPPVPGKWPPSPYCKIEERYPEKHLRENLEERLTNLRMEKLDVLLLHTWTRAWNDNPKALHTLQGLKSEGLVDLIGISTPEHDQNCVIQLMREGLIDVVQVIYNIFDQDPAAQLLPVAEETGTGIIVRVAFDEGVLTGKYKGNEKFGADDFRSNYFAGDRLARSVKRVERIREEFGQSGYTLPQLALKFSLSHPAASTVIPGIRNVEQAEQNTAVSELPDLDEILLEKLREHAWNRAFWYGGK
jgi:aryl-alcohol dehydrogenase-like predicted oxidoreductase